MGEILSSASIISAGRIIVSNSMYNTGLSHQETNENQLHHPRLTQDDEADVEE